MRVEGTTAVTPVGSNVWEELVIVRYRFVGGQ